MSIWTSWFGLAIVIGVVFLIGQIRVVDYTKKNMYFRLFFVTKF